MTNAEEYTENETVTQAEALSREFERDSRRYSRMLSLVEDDE